jgi:hypothetical protein
MAQPILCDQHDRAHAADVLVSQLANGETFGACGAGFLEFCRSLVEQADQEEADATAADVAARLEGITPPPGSDQGPNADGFSDAYLESERAAVFPTSTESSDAGAADPEQPTSSADEPSNSEQTTPDQIARHEPPQAVTEAAE